MYVTNPVFGDKNYTTDFQVLMFQRHTFSGSAGFLFRNKGIFSLKSKQRKHELYPSDIRPPVVLISLLCSC